MSDRNQIAQKVPWRASAWVAGGFCFLLGLALLLGHWAGKDRDPWRSPQLKAEKEKLRENPKDEVAKQRIRQLDLELRQRYFQQLARMSSGTVFLLSGAALFLYAWGRFARRALPMPPAAATRVEITLKDAAKSRWSAAAVGGAALIGLMALTLTPTANLDQALAAFQQPTDSKGNDAPNAADAASIAELKMNWPRFLGWNAGLSASTNPPSRWDAATGEGIAWKVPVLVEGFNSPVVWGEKVFYSGGDAKKREVICLDAKTGKLIWRQEIANVPGTPAAPPEIPESTSYAAPTMATDGRRVYALFANGDLAALSMDGKVLWSKGFGALRNAYGHATSLATWSDRVIVQLDQGEAEDNKSKLYAFDGRSGKVIWERPRKVGASWASPTVFEHAGKGQVVCLSLPHAIGYAADSGTELWRADVLNGEVCPSPVYAGGFVLVASPSDRIVAIRPDGASDVTKTHVSWTNDENVPDVTSPVSDGRFVFEMSTSGLLTCLEVQSGKKVWDHDYESEFHASPAIAGGRVYLVSQKGEAVVVAAGPEFKEVFRGPLSDSFHASPAIVQDRVYLRGVTNVWCLATAPAKAASAP